MFMLCYITCYAYVMLYKNVILCLCYITCYVIYYLCFITCYVI